MIIYNATSIEFEGNQTIFHAENDGETSAIFISNECCTTITKSKFDNIQLLVE